MDSRPFWERDRPQQPQHEQPETSTQQTLKTTSQWRRVEKWQNLKYRQLDEKFVGVKNVQSTQMGNAPRVNAEEPNNWNLGNAVRETENNISADMQLLMIETINDPTSWKR